MNFSLEEKLCAWLMALQEGEPADFGTDESPLMFPAFTLSEIPVVILEGLNPDFSAEHNVPAVIISAPDLKPQAGNLHYAPALLVIETPLNRAETDAAFHTSLVQAVTDAWATANLSALTSALAPVGLDCDGFYLSGSASQVTGEVRRTVLSYNLGISKL